MIHFASGPLLRLLLLASLVVALTASGCRSFEHRARNAAPVTVNAFVFVPAADARLQVTDAVRPVILAGGVVRFDRGLDTPGRGFRWDSPGTRLRWRTNSAATRVHLRYTGRHIGASRNSVGVFRVDGRTDPTWTFTRPGAGDADLVLDLPVPPGGGVHDYEVILPYGDSVDLLGIDVEPGANLEPPPPRPAVRYLAFGDSVTHGFTASDVTKSYAFRLSARQDWELLNLGIGGRGAVGDDGAVLAEIDAHVVSVLIGVNDWQGGTELEAFRQAFSEFMRGLRQAGAPRRIFVITPLWVPPNWQAPTVKYPLERYREIIRAVVAAAGDRRLRLIEGDALIDHDPALFDAVAVHPNDLGFAQMADRLAAAMQ